MEQITGGESPLRSQHDIVMARQTVRRLSQELGFSLVDQTKMVTAASELARNTLIYGGGGIMHWQTLRNASRKGLRLIFSDQGPGIPNLELALTDGWTSGSGLGLGLSGARRLVNEFEIESSAAAGTKVTIVRWS
jgi:serine/threonine-protein kinase RsbT